MNIAIVLTLLRIALVPVLILVFYLPVTWSAAAATFVFALAAITDWFDGYMARRLNLTTSFGAFLDPVADKIIVAVALVLVVEFYASPWLAIPAGIIITREIVISALREWMATAGKRTEVAVSYIGKIKTTMQMVALLLLLHHDPLWGLPIVELGYISLYIAAILTVWSMVLYLKAAIPNLHMDD